MIRPTLIDLNPVELNYYQLMVILGKCSGSYNSVDDLSTKICVPSKIKDINVKVFDMIARTNEAKTMIIHAHMIANANSTVQLAVQIKNRKMKHVNVSVKAIAHAKTIIVGILGHVFVTYICESMVSI